MTYKKLAFLSCLILLLFLKSSPAGAQEKMAAENTDLSFRRGTLKTIIVDNYQPYTFVNDAGEPDGFSVEIARAVTRAMGLKLEIRADKWDEAIKELQSGSIDLLPMMAYSTERDKVFDFSIPHTIAYDAVFQKKGTSDIRSLDNLSGKTVIVLNKDVAHSYLVSSGLSKSMSINPVDSLPEAFKQLAAGKGDVAIMPKLVGIVILKKLDMNDIESTLVIDAYTRPFSFAVRNGNQELLERLNQGLNIIKSSGQYNAIYNKWFELIEDPHFHWKTALKLGFVFVLFLLGFIVWNSILRRQVKARTEHLDAEIAERKRAEEVALQAKRDWEDSFDTISDIITIHDTDCNIVRANKAAKSFLGLAMSDILNNKCFKFYHGTECPPEICPSCDTLKTGLPSTTEMFEPHLNKFLEFHAVARFDTDHNIIGVVHLVRDITERRKAEAALQRYSAEIEKHNKEFRNLIEEAPLAITVVNKADEIEYINKKNVEVIGYTRNETPTLEVWWSLVYPDQEERKKIIDAWGDIQRRVLSGERIGKSERRITCKDGKIKDVELSFSRAGEKILVMFNDITQHRYEEKEKEKLINELKDALANVKILGEMLPICSYCKKIRDDKGYWDGVETYISKHTDTVFSHGACPECAEKAMKEFEELKKKHGQ
jgi:PAS domain S-box-containing protein